jgi:hypothetical protein
MLLLTSPADQLQIVTSAASTIHVHATWVDTNTSTGVITPGRTNTTISTAATTSVAGSPAAGVQRNVKTLHIRNNHATIACDVTVQLTDGTVTSQLYKRSLLSAGALQYTDQGGFGTPTSFVQKTGDTMSGDLTIHKGTPAVSLNKTASGQDNLIYGFLNGVTRWAITPGDSTAESGGNTGSEFRINRHSDAGAYIDSPFTMYRSSGQIAMAGDLAIIKANPVITLDKTASGQENFIYGFVNGGARWAVIPGSSAAESGGNAGSNFAINRYSDAGAFIDTALMINRATALVTLSDGLTLNGQVDSLTGYRGRAGVGGAPSNTFNINWTGSAQLWVDATNVGTIQIVSDYRFKKDVTDAPPALDQVLQWRPITYTGRAWGIFPETEDVRHSFLAHELQAIAPDCVIGEKDGEQPQSLDLVPIVARLTKALQELTARVQALEAQIA